MVTGSPAVVTLNLSFSASNDTTYGLVSGSGATTQTHVIKVNHSSMIQFSNVDAVYAHQIDNLGPWSGSFPASDTVTNTGSPGGTDISVPNFSTGVIPHGAASATFLAPASAGVWVFGDRTYYSTSGMRTVIIAL